MRHYFVMALAFLTVALTGGTCEFRAASGNPVHDQPPGSKPSEGGTGLVVVVNNGVPESIPNDSTIESSIIGSALATSVLSTPIPAPDPSADSPPPHRRPGEAPALSAIQTKSPHIANPIPEPGGFWLYGLGGVFLSWRLRWAKLSTSASVSV